MAESKDYYCSAELESLEKLVTCEVCNDILKDPKGLPCLHTFCFECIQSWFQTCEKERNPFNCPTCRASIRAPEGDVTNLPTSFQTNSLIKIYNSLMLKKKQQDFKDAKVQITKQNDVLQDMLQMCMTTQELVGEDMKKTNKEIDSAEEKVIRDAALQIKMVTAQIKDDERAKLEQLKADRAKHEESHQTKKNEISACIKQILELSSQCKQAADIDIDHFLERDFQRLLNNCKTTIDRTVTTLADNQLQASNAATEQTEEATEHAKSSQRALDTGKSTTEQEGHSQATTINCTAKTQFLSIWCFPTSMITNPKTLALNSRGEIAVIGDDYKKDWCIKIYSADGTYTRQIGVEGSGEELLRSPSGIAFISDDRLLVSANLAGYAFLKEYHIQGRFLRTVCKQRGMCYFRMCAVGQSIACLSYNERSKETFIKLICKETGTSPDDIKLDAPKKSFPLYLTRSRNKYFVIFANLHSVYVFAERGNLLYTIGQKGNQPGQFICPRGLAVFGDNMLLVCDSGNYCVQLLDQGDRHIRSFGGRGSNLGEMEGPRDLFVTRNGQIFLLEDDNQRIQIFGVVCENP